MVQVLERKETEFFSKKTGEHLFIARKNAMQLRAMHMFQDKIAISDFNQVAQLWTTKSAQFGNAFHDKYVIIAEPFCSEHCSKESCDWDKSKNPREKSLGCLKVSLEFIQNFVNF